MSMQIQLDRDVPLGVGIIGLGYGMSVIAPAFRLDPRIVLRAVSAQHTEKSRKVAQQFDGVRAIGDWRELIAANDIDIVAVAVPPPVQSEIVANALQCRKHVFAEKPLADSTAAADALCALSMATPCAAMIDFNFREVPAIAAAHNLLQNGGIGELDHVSINWHVETRVYAGGLDHWKARRQDGGGALANFGSHSLDLIEWLAGPIISLSGQLGRIHGDFRSGESQVGILFETIAGASGVLSLSCAAFAGSGHRLEFFGRDGSLCLSNHGPDSVSGFRLALYKRGETSPLPLSIANWPKNIDGDQRIYPTFCLVRRFINWVCGGPPQAPGFTEGARVQALMEAVTLSHSTHQRVACAPRQ